MNVYINGNAYSLSSSANNEGASAEHCTVALALDVFLNEVQAQTSFAVALNGNFVGKQSYSHTCIKNDDSIDVLFPIVGG